MMAIPHILGGAAVWVLTRPPARPPEELESHDASVLP